MVVCLEHWLQELWVLHIRTGLQLEDRLKTAVISQLLYDEKSKTYHVERFNDFAHFENEDRLLRKHFGSGFFKKK